MCTMDTRDQPTPHANYDAIATLAEHLLQSY